MSDQVYQAISEQRRREILRLIQARELPAGEIARHFEVTQPAISQHLRVLLEAGLVTVRHEGTRRLYLARPAGFQEVREFLEGFWDASLIQLKRAAEEEERGTRRNGLN